MELKFIWVKQYRIIKETGFNFNHSGDHKFLYQDGILQLETNIKGPIDFGRKITGVTAIAGENGSGKSSLCEISLLTTATWTNGMFGYDEPFTGIVCYANYIFIHKELQVNNQQELTEQGYKVIIFENSPFEDMREEWRDSFLKEGFIYYSNTLDFRGDFSVVNLSNISSQNLVNEDYRYGTSYASVMQSELGEGHKDKHSPMTIYYYGQGYRFTKFYLAHPEFIPFKKPEYIVVKSAYSGNNKWLYLNSFSDYGITRTFHELESSIFDTLCKKSYPQSDFDLELDINEAVSKTAIHTLYKLNLLVSLGVAVKSLPDFKAAANFIYHDKIARKLFKDYDKVVELVKIHKTIVENAEIITGKFKPFSMTLHYKEYKEWRFSLIETMYIINNKSNLKLLKKFMTLEEEILQSQDRTYRRITNYLLYPHLSAGENSFMTFFSRLYDVILRYEKGGKEKENLLIFIDEAEIGFHPEWMKSYFKWIIDFLNNLTFDYSFQLILTTHSPYLLSDLPSENVLLLQKGKSGKTEIVLPETFKSFGSNIHELLATNFFMKDGFMGEFAKLKIEELVEYLKDKKSQKFTPESALRLISSVGDDLISSRLIDYYNEKFGTASVTQTNEEYRKWLESELARTNLNQQLNDKN